MMAADTLSLQSTQKKRGISTQSLPQDCLDQNEFRIGEIIPPFISSSKKQNQ
jgi:hypothetical protein